jgi:hypothetical protein
MIKRRDFTLAAAGLTSISALKLSGQARFSFYFSSIETSCQIH